MRALNTGINWMANLDYLRQPLAQELEIGLGLAIWAGLVFVVVHFGGIAT
jgi:hypothetical protein